MTVDHYLESTGGMPLETWLMYRTKDWCQGVRTEEDR
jgi:hypothetical protein